MGTPLASGAHDRPGTTPALSAAAAQADEQKWPQTLWLLRHGQSAGNVARDLAEAAGHDLIDIAHRDVDVPLSALGERQADAVGQWFATLPAAQRPTRVLCSPYARAMETARRVTQCLQADDVLLHHDERLREKEFGILDRLTVQGIRSLHPQLAEQRQHVGKFYFRPPGGESWCDVILRLRSVVEMLAREHRQQRVLIVAHQVTVNCFRYLLEHMSEQQILDIDRQGDVPNCGLTSYAYCSEPGRAGRLLPQLVNFVAPLLQAGETVTAEPDAPAAAKP